MPAYQVVPDIPLLAAIDERSQGEQWGSRPTEQNKVHQPAQPDLAPLKYLVFDGDELVAAFAMRSDAEHWIEDCGNHAMTLGNADTIVHAGKLKSSRKTKKSAR